MAIEDVTSYAPVISTRGWSFDTLLAQSPNFVPVQRVSFDSADLLTVIRDSEKNGTPLVIQDFQRHPKWPKSMFTLENFSENATSPDISVRNVHDWTDKKIPLVDFVAECRQSPLFSGPGETVRYYGKDAECPREWEDWLQNADVIPNKFLPGGSDDVLHSDSDTVSIETLMCYLGIGDTFTPCHKDLCASSGQNLMCYTENDGASFWFMTKSGDAGKVDRYFSSLGQDLDHENHVVTTRELARSNFTVYIVEQKLGDLVLVPPRSCHQVVNYGGITIKTSWSRMTLEGLETALYHELPLYQRVCRFETYRVKSTVHRVLQENVSSLETMLSRSEEGLPEGSHKFQATAGPSIDTTELRQLLLNRVSHLLRVYSSILAEELCTTFQKSTLGPAQDTHLVCDFCGCDVFQSFFECQDACFETDGDGYKQHCIICPGCFVEGRTCACGDMKPMQRYDFEKLLALRTRGIEILNEASFQHSFEAKFAKASKHIESPRTFKAACALLRYMATAPRRRCSYSEASIYRSHECMPYWILPCAPCHRSRCFTHIAKNFKVHSIDALLLHQADKSPQVKYHTKHSESSRAHNQAMDELAYHQKHGTQPKGCTAHLYNALYHKHCRPVKPAITSPGWYDEIMQGVSLEDPANSVDVVTEKDNPLLGEPPCSLPDEAELATPVTAPDTGQAEEDDVIQVSPLVRMPRSMDDPRPTTMTKKRKYTVFVEIPPLPYRIRTSSTLRGPVPQPLVKIDPTRTPNRNMTFVAKSGLRARRSIVENSSPNEDSPKDPEYLRSAYVAETGSPVARRTSPVASSCLARLPKIPKIKRYNDAVFKPSVIQPSTSTSTDTSTTRQTSSSHAVAIPGYDREHARLDMHRYRQLLRDQDAVRANIYRQHLPPKDGVFYLDSNGQRRYGYLPESASEPVSHSHYSTPLPTTSWPPRPSPSRNNQHQTMDPRKRALGNQESSSANQSMSTSGPWK